MVCQVEMFTEEYVKTNRATGELEHPEYPNLDARRACHLITELRRDGKVFYGKSKILSTPDGKIVESLLNDGVQLGVSSRSIGEVDEKTGLVTDFQLCTFDIVHDPSCQKAFVNGILENRSWVCSYNEKNERLYEEFDKRLERASKQPPRYREADVLSACLELVKALR